MKTRRSIRNQKILWRELGSQLAAAAAASSLPVEQIPNCFNCTHYPDNGRNNQVCKRFTRRISGASVKVCFLRRGTQCTSN